SSPERQLALFALLNLGLVESLASGSISAADAVRIFFHAENCLFVRQRLRDRTADEVMSRGTQLPDLFDALPPKEAQREFQRELTAIRSLCLSLLAEQQLAA
ncbi:MAG TPA: hypothetical protein VE715_01985, partial [Blastocatellia bacterium]|nr:hypothetical protein [Blastocatellia bacterium]